MLHNSRAVKVTSAAVDIITTDRLENPEEGLGLQQAVLEEVAAGRRGSTALLWSSGRSLAATRSETRLPGFAEARRAAESSGFPVLVRDSGGGAVAADEGCISFSLTVPVEALRQGLYERYALAAEVVVGALGRLGIEAEPGEVEGEFCPGAYSVRMGGPEGIKVAGLAQRVTKRAARVEALVLVETAGIAAVLQQFYDALGLHFRPESVGDLGVGKGEAADALVEEVRRRYGGTIVEPDGGLLGRARSLRGEWRAAP